MKNSNLFQLIICIMIAGFLSACGPSFSDYMANVRSANTNASVIREASVVIGQSNVRSPASRNSTLGAVITGVNIASDVAAAAVSMEQEKRLQQLVSSENLSQIIYTSFAEQYPAISGVSIVSPDQHSDIRIVILVNAYGISANSMTDPFTFFMDSNVKVIYLPENKAIYNERIQLVRALSDLEMYGTIVSSAISAAMNLSAFFTLSDEQITEIFNYLAQELGKTAAISIFDASHK